jgi:glycerol-3-phosphate dehydrogenase
VSRKDLLVIGGGISGAAVALAAARRGLSVLLVERHDYASGASSNSSKLVHGGLRYLKQGAWGLMRESLQAREQLLRDAPGLVRPMPFLMPHRPGGSPGRLAMRAGLFVYDQLAGRRTRRFLSAAQVQAEVPGLAAEWGASGYEDASTDDARLTLRLLQEAREAGAELCNHSSLLGLERAEDGEGGEGGGRVRAARVRGTRRLRAPCRDGLRDRQRRRPARQPGRRVATAPAAPAAAARQPSAAAAGAPALALRGGLEPRARRPAGVRLPLAGRAAGGYHRRRPARRAGAAAPQPRRAGLPDRGPEPGLPARRPWRRRCAVQLERPAPGHRQRRRPPPFRRAPRTPGARGAGCGGPERRQAHHLRRHGRGGAAGGRALVAKPLKPLKPLQPLHGPLLPPAADGVWGDRLGPALRGGEQIGGTPLAAIRHSLQHEQVRHLDDLLLRRTRLGLLRPGFAAALLPTLQAHCQELLGWDTPRFAQEVERYLALMQDEHGVHA